MKNFLKLCLFIYISCSFSAHAFHIQEIKTVEQGKTIFEAYKEYYQRGVLKEEDFLKTLKLCLSSKTYHLYAVSEKESSPIIAFIDVRVFYSLYSGGDIARIDSAYIVKKIDSDDQKKEIIKLFDQKLKELEDIYKLKKITANSGQVYDIEKAIFKELLGPENDNVVFARYPNKLKAKL